MFPTVAFTTLPAAVQTFTDTIPEPSTVASPHSSTALLSQTSAKLYSSCKQKGLSQGLPGSRVSMAF